MTSETVAAGVCPRPRCIRIREEEYSVPCGSRYCVACGQRWQGDARVVAVAASEHLGRGAGLVTVTAPGSAVLGRLMREHDLRLGEVIALWNHTARRRWRALHRIASRRASRFARKRGGTFRMLYRSWEYQERGLLHVHVVTPASTLLEVWATRIYVNALHERGPDFGFGFILGGGSRDSPSARRPPVLRLADGPKAARYVCKYVSSVGAGKEGMVKVAQRTAQRGSVLYVSPTLTRASGASMTTLRARRRVWARYPWARDRRDLWRAACHVDAMQRGRPPFSREEAERIGRAVCGVSRVSWCDWTGEEASGATRAPEPGQIRRQDPPEARPGTRCVLRLAPVLLRGGPPDHLGPWRSVATISTGSVV